MAQQIFEPIKESQLLTNQTPEEEKYSLKINKLFNCFKSLISSKPDFVVKVPGRVNLIGEHIDYCKYSVCPMALEQNILVALKSNDNGELNIININGQLYKDYHGTIEDFRIQQEVGKAPQWYEYFLCGVKGIQDIIEKDSTKTMKGLTVLVFGTVPPAAGLSSSSALVSAAVLATSIANQISLSKSQLADLSASAERYIGTQGGGMDQAIAFLATKGCAKHISFDPLIGTDVTLPKEAVFVVAQSLATKNKAQSAEFNTRVVECRLAAKIIAKLKNVEKWKEVLYLGELQKDLKLSLKEMIQLTNQLLEQDLYSKDDIIKILGVSEEELETKFLSLNTKNVTEFKLKQRASHVYQEAERVAEFLNVCNSDKSSEQKLRQLGQLMNESHVSLKTQYECSHEALDSLVECFLNAKAYGARLTGAGWGGCVVALSDKSNVESLLTQVSKSFYGDIKCSKDLIFQTQPQNGAMIFRCDDQGGCEIINFD